MEPSQSLVRLYNMEQLCTWTAVLFLCLTTRSKGGFPYGLETDQTFLKVLLVAQGTQTVDIVMAFFRITKTNWFVSFKQIFTRLYAVIVMISLIYRTQAPGYTGARIENA